MMLTVKAANVIRLLAVWGLFALITVAVPMAFFLAVKELFAVTIALTWKTWVSFWVVFLLMRLDVRFKLEK